MVRYLFELLQYCGLTKSKRGVINMSGSYQITDILGLQHGLYFVTLSLSPNRCIYLHICIGVGRSGTRRLCTLPTTSLHNQPTYPLRLILAGDKAPLPTHEGGRAPLGTYQGLPKKKIPPHFRLPNTRKYLALPLPSSAWGTGIPRRSHSPFTHRDNTAVSEEWHNSRHRM